MPVYIGRCTKGHEVISSAPDITICGHPDEYHCAGGEIVVDRYCGAPVEIHEAGAEELEASFPGFTGEWPPYGRGGRL